MSITGIPDTGDLISRDLPDPEPAEISDPDHHDYVEPFAGAEPIKEEK